MFAKELFTVSYLSTHIPPGRYPMTQTGLECLFLEIMYVFGTLNFGSAFGGLFAWYLIFVIWNFPDKTGFPLRYNRFIRFRDL